MSSPASDGTPQVPDEATLRHMLRRAYGPRLAPATPVASRLGHATRNLVLGTRLATGQPVVLKIAPAHGAPVLDCQADVMGAEVEALHRIAEHTDVPVPDLHHHDDTFEVLEREWFAMSFLDGTPLGALDERQRADASLQRSLSEAMRALHQIEGEGFGLPTNTPMQSWCDAFTGLVEDLLSDAVRLGVDLGLEADHLHGLLLRHAAVLDEVEVPVHCWANPDPADVLVRDGRLAGLVDHEHCLWADPLLDVAPWVAAASGTRLPGPAAVRAELYALHRALLGCLSAVLRGHQQPGAGPMAALAAAARRLERHG